MAKLGRCIFLLRMNTDLTMLARVVHDAWVGLWGVIMPPVRNATAWQSNQVGLDENRYSASGTARHGAGGLASVEKVDDEDSDAQYDAVFGTEFPECPDFPVDDASHVHEHLTHDQRVRLGLATHGADMIRPTGV
jgi:hypothetical protein